MALQQLILELGMGADVHGHDYTKASLRAISDAIRHSSLTLFAALNRHPNEMTLEVTIAVPRPDLVDKDAVAAALPFGTVTVTVVKGGLHDKGMGGMQDVILANAAVKAFLDIDDDSIKLS